LDYFLILLGVQIVLTIGILILPWYLASYIARRTKNLATKEDIAEIARKVEAARATRTERVTAVERSEPRQQQASSAAVERSEQRQQSPGTVDRRLEAHQEAYALWWKLVDAVNNDKKVMDVSLECQNWWVKNCLYLDAEARLAFNRAYFAAAARPALLRQSRDARPLEENWQLIFEAGEAIVRGVPLPSLGDAEYRSLPPK
jgi:hypothetical protein